MANPKSAFKGVIRGKVIELEREPGLPDGQEVNVTFEPTSASEPERPYTFLTEENRRRWEEASALAEALPTGEGPPQPTGSWAEDAEDLDDYLEWNRQQRKVNRREIEP